MSRLPFNIHPFAVFRQTPIPIRVETIRGPGSRYFDPRAPRQPVLRSSPAGLPNLRPSRFAKLIAHLRDAAERAKGPAIDLTIGAIAMLGGTVCFVLGVVVGFVLASSIQ